MLTILRSLMVAILCVIVFISCQKEVDNTPVTSSTGVFKAKIDGVQYTATIAGGSVVRNVMAITASSADKKYFSIVISDTLTGTYILDQNASHGILFIDSTDTNKSDFSSNQGNDTMQAGGKVTITSIDKVNKTISGTFSCKVYRNQDSRQKIITEGSFKVSYTSGVPAAKSTDTLRVKIDGVDWTPKAISGVLSSGLIAVTASELNLSKALGLQFPQSTNVGTYNFDYLGSNVGIYLPDGATASVADSSGSFTILEYNKTTKRIRGNFNFKATELQTSKSYQLTSGYFSVGYTQ